MSTRRRFSGARYPTPWGSGRGVRSVVGLALLGMITMGCKDRPADKDDDDDEGVPQKTAPSTGSPSTAAAPAASSPRAAGQAPTTWTFDSAPAGQAPAGFSFVKTGSGRPGRWVVRAAADAPSGPNVLAQEDSDATDYRFPVAVADGLTFHDVSVSVRCKPVSGRVDQACGLVFRYQDENNYYLTRANALENNVCWYYVQNGRRIEVKRVRIPVASGVWHSLRADIRANHIEVFFNDQKLIDVHDSRFTAPGKVGVWTKADSQTLFDDLIASPLTP